MHGLIFRSSQPLDIYDKVSEEIDKRVAADEQSAQLWQTECLLHLARRTDAGFEVTEVWTSEEAAQTWFDNLLQDSLRVGGFDHEAAEMVTFEPHVLEVHQRESENA